MNQIYADIILFDTVCIPYNGSMVDTHGMGGSEFQAILLLEELAKLGKKVICLNNTRQTVEHNNVLYMPNKDVVTYQFNCAHLIVHRSSKIPVRIKYDKIYQWVTDMNGPDNLPFYDLLDRKLCKLITLSKFSNDQYPDCWNKRVINFMIPDWVYEYKIPEVKQDFIYASSMMKGYLATIRHWDFIKSRGLLDNKTLNVCLPGYDNPAGDISIKELNINYMGTLTFKNVVDTIARCEGMFYVNIVPETFCISAVLAEILKTTPHIYCLNGIGALDEVLNSNTITTDVKHFMDNINTNISVYPKQFRSTYVVNQWVELFKE